ncbi:MAG: SIMPL domain-containing protein [Polyangiaceae bacterium]
MASILGLSAIASSTILARATIEAFNIKHAEKRIVVTGSATRRIRSDFVVWRAEVKSQAPEMSLAYKKLAADVPTVVEFLKARGIDPKQIKVSATAIDEIHARDKDGRELPETTVAFVTVQQIEVSSGDIEKVERVSREATELIDRGVYIHSEEPLYIYTKLAELKVKMAAEASRDARNRAEQMALQAKTQLTSLISSRMGVMQINPAYETSVSAEGNNDRSSLEKDVLAVATATYGVR